MPRAIVYIQFICKPLTDRIRLGEGGIAVFNITHTYWATRDLTQILISTIVSILTLCALYGYNDYTDRDIDRNNPKKDQGFVQNISDYRADFVIMHVMLCLTVSLICFFLMGASHVAILLVLLGVNALYSNRWKALAGLDLLIVMAWGGIFTLLSATVDPRLSIIAGVMTGVAHFFQMLMDVESDIKSNVGTTLARYRSKAPYILISLCAVLGVLLMVFYKNLPLSLSAMLPVVFYYSFRRVAVSWFLSRAYFFATWLLMLNVVYGGF